MKYEDKPRGRSPEWRAKRNAQIRQLRADGLSYSEISLRMNLSDKTVRRALKAKPPDP